MRLAIFAVLVALAGGARVRGDGGTVQFRRQAGAFSITVFTSPTPLRAGTVDVSVLAQDAGSGAAALDARVAAEFSRPGAAKVRVELARGAAANRLLYAVPVNLSAGNWEMLCWVTRGGETVQAAGRITVLPEEPPLRTEWPYFAIVPLTIGLYILNRYLKRRRSVYKR